VALVESFARVAVTQEPSDRDQALARLASEVGRRGYAIALDLLRNPVEAEDAVQESLARACEAWGDLRSPEALAGWFFRVLTNLCMRGLRRRRIVNGFKKLLGMAGEPAATPVDATDFGRTLDAVDDLPAMQRAAVVLRYGHDLEVADIAAMLDVKPGTVKTHLVRGLEALRERLGSKEHDGN
jgi:RNA polymerase sigma-70 factor (ECF subfamily)